MQGTGVIDFSSFANFLHSLVNALLNTGSQASPSKKETLVSLVETTALTFLTQKGLHFDGFSISSGNFLTWFKKEIRDVYLSILNQSGVPQPSFTANKVRNDVPNVIDVRAGATLGYQFENDDGPGAPSQLRAVPLNSREAESEYLKKLLSQNKGGYYDRANSN